MARKPADADVFHAVADPTRRGLLDLLLLRPDQCVAELAAHFRCTQPAISQHLRVLRRSGLVTFARVDREHRYQLTALPLAAIGAWVHPYQRAFAADLAAVRRVRGDGRRRRRGAAGR